MSHERDTYIGTCPTCGKRRYTSKVAAKGKARQLRARGRMSAYRCGEYWHVGHLPSVVRRGRAERPR